MCNYFITTFYYLCFFKDLERKKLIILSYYLTLFDINIIVMNIIIMQDEWAKGLLEPSLTFIKY